MHRGRLARFFRDWLGFEFVSRIYLYSSLIGLISGLCAIIFTYSLELAHFLLVEKLAGFRPIRYSGTIHFDFSFLGAPSGGEHLWLLLLLPALGGLISGWLTYRFAPEAQGAGTDAIIDAFHNQRGQIRPIVAPTKALSTIITLSSGGAAGQQGPLMQIGASLGSWIGARLKLSAAQRRILLLAGTAGGLGAIFRAPLDAAITSVEVLYREDFESDALIPCVISSFVAYSLYMAVFGFSYIFTLPDLLFANIRELIFYLILGFLCALVGIIYVKSLRFARRLFNRLPLPNYWVVCCGGLLVGGLAFVDPRVLGAGFGVIQQGLDGELDLRALLILALLKIIASSCTVSSGGAGGVFAHNFSIYQNQVQNKFHSLAHVKYLTVNVLQNLRVREVLPMLQNTTEAVISNELAYFSLNALSKKLGHLHFVVVNADNKLRGMISLDDLDVPEDEFLRNLILIEDIVVDNVSPLDLDDDLRETLQRLLDSGYDKLPVVETAEDGEGSFRGYIMYLDLIRVYNEEVAKFEGKE